MAIIDDEWGGDALCLFDDDTGDVTVVQPNEDGSYWRKVVRNKVSPRSLYSHWSPYDRVRVVNADP